MAYTLQKISPAIMSIRIERLLSKIVEGDKQAAIRLCKVYCEDLEKTTTIFERCEIVRMGEKLFEIELLIMVDVFDLAIEKVKAFQEMVISKLIMYQVVKKRMLDNRKEDRDIGTLDVLPMDILFKITNSLQDEYCW
jgi:hypothetical protein